MKKKRDWKYTRWPARIALILLAVCTLLFLTICGWLRYTVLTVCQQAQATYEGDCVTSLSKVVSDENQSIRTRNDAIWALGQLADKRALPVLNTYYTGIIPEKEPLDTTLSQYELKKAITWCTQGNGTSWIYYHLN